MPGITIVRFGGNPPLHFKVRLYERAAKKPADSCDPSKFIGELPILRRRSSWSGREPIELLGPGSAWILEFASRYGGKR
jgi:hypothetical protein